VDPAPAMNSHDGAVCMSVDDANDLLLLGGGGYEVAC